MTKTFEQLQKENALLLQALDQYRQGDEHINKNEYVAAAAHYEEAERLRALAMSTEPDL